MNTPEEEDEPTIKGINAADLLARGLESAKAATGNPQAWRPPTPEELAALLPQYEIESLLGRGGMGAVYRGKQAALDRAVAIKLLPAELAADAEFMSRFQREARTLAKLQHPGIVAVHDFGQTSQGHLYFVMEFVNGTDLSRLIHGPGVNSAQALEIIAQVCEALQYAHGQGVIHRDIKPANVLINTEGRAKLADFGLARPTSEETASLTRSNVVMGTPDYMAPEQMAGTADHRADLYALGVMLYEMLTGQTPRGAWAPPSQRVQVDVRLDQVVVRALQQDPAMRYQQASEIKTDVDVIRTTPLPKAGKAKVKLAAEAPGQRTTPLPKAKKPANKLALAAAIVLPLLAVAGWWVTQCDPKPTASDLPWQKAEWPQDVRYRHIDSAGWLKTQGTFLFSNSWMPPVRLNDAAVRMTIRWEADTTSVVIGLRDSKGVRVETVIERTRITLRRYDPQIEGKVATISKAEHSKPFATGDETILEMAAIGQAFYARLNGKVIHGSDLLVSKNGAMVFGGANAVFGNIEYAILDGIADPLKAMGWEVPQENAYKPAGATPSEAVLKARERGGRLRVSGRGPTGAFELGEAGKFDDFVQVLVSHLGWAARRRNGDTFLGAWGHQGQAMLPFGPYNTRFLSRTAYINMLLTEPGQARNVWSQKSQVLTNVPPFSRSVIAVMENVFALGPRGEQTRLYGDGTNDMKDFFAGSTAISGTEDYFVISRPGEVVKSWCPKKKTLHAFADETVDVVEIDGASTFVALRHSDGRVTLATPDGQALPSTAFLTTHRTTNAGFVAVRAGRGMAAAQKPDGNWLAWGESEKLPAQVAALGHVIDLDFDYDGKQSELLMWIEPVEGSTAAAPVSTSSSGNPIVDEVVAWVFKNQGNVVIIQSDKRVSVRSLEQIQPGRFALTEVHLPGGNVTDTEFARLGSLSGLQKIELNGASHITSLKPIAGLTDLNALWLPENQGLAEEELAHLAGMNKLGSLRLKLPGATGEGFRHLQRLPKLMLLSLHGAEFTEKGAEAIAGLANLDWLLLLDGTVREGNQKSLAAIGRMPKLTSLDIDGTLTSEGFAALAPLKLTKVNLSSCKLDNAGFPLLTGSSTTLKELDMAWGATVADDGIRHITANFPNIERISASYGSTCTGASLRELAKLPKLKSISWWVKGMTTADYVLLADLPVIEGIGVGFGSAITDEALPAFAKCQHLSDFDLSETKITDAGLKTLQNIRPLKTVNLQKTKITPAGLAEFQKARPDVHVTHNIDAAGAVLPSK